MNDCRFSVSPVNYPDPYPDAWCNKRDSERKKIMQRFYRNKGRSSKYVTSTNGQLTVPQTPGGGGGEKPHQRKRMAAERTTPRK